MKNLISKQFHRLHLAYFNSINDRFPRLAYYTFTWPKDKFDFKIEKKLERGIHISSSEHQSIIHFSVHKCATVYVSNILKKLSAANGLVNVDFSEYFSRIDHQKYDLLSKDHFLKSSFLPTGYHYGAFRGYFHIPHIDQFKVVLMLRDPRDVLTSAYYSARYSHPNINLEIIRRKELINKNNLSIDEFVKQKAPIVKANYEKYIKFNLKKQNVLFTRYEAMIQDFDGWLNEIVEFTGFNDRECVQQVKKLHKRPPLNENINIHRRNVTPGDHKEKLGKDTINYINEQFGQVLNILNYEV